MTQLLREARRIADLILHMLKPAKDREAGMRIGLHDRGTVFIMFLGTAEGNIRMPLHFRRQRREGLVLQTVRHLTAQVPIAQLAAGRDKIRPDGLVVAPQDLLQRPAV